MSDIKCPICQNNLHKINIVVSTCTNDKCKLWGSSIPNLVLEALTQAKQDLEIARQALKDIKSDYELYSEQGCRMEPNETDMYNYARNALEQIKQKD